MATATTQNVQPGTTLPVALTVVGQLPDGAELRPMAEAVEVEVLQDPRIAPSHCLPTIHKQSGYTALLYSRYSYGL